MAKQKKKSSQRPLGQRISHGFGEFTEAVESFFKRCIRSVGETLGMVFSLLVPKSLLRKVERTSASPGAQKLGKQVGEFTDQVEKKFSKGATGLLDVLQSIFAILVPEFIRVRVAKVFQAVWKRVAGLFRQLGKGLDRFAEKYLPKWLVRAVKQTWRAIQQRLKALSRFAWVWGSTRDYKKLAWSTPVILMTLPLIAGLVLFPMYSSADRIHHYNVEYAKALSDQDYTKADLYARKLGQLGYQRMERAEYQEAMALAKEKRYDEAYGLMKTIAPESEPGYLTGHLWIAGLLNDGLITSEPEERVWPLIKVHTDHAASLEESNPIVQYLRIKIAQHEGLPVIRLMQNLARSYPEFYGELWVHYVQAGELGNAKLAARRFSAYCEGLVKSKRSLSDYMLWASAQEMLGNTERAREITIEGGENFQDAPELKKMAAIVLLAELKSIDQNSDQALELLKRAHEIDPTNEYVIRSLGSRLANDNTLRMRRLIDELKTTGKLSSEVLLASGDVHVRAFRYDEAKQFYAEACEYDPKSGRGHNNIAWLYANVQPVSFEIALGAANRAIEIEKDAEFFETRGQIYFKRGKSDWQKAVDDLETAVNGVLPKADRQRAHETLAQIYDSRGDTEVANAHRLQATSPDAFAQQP